MLLGMPVADLGAVDALILNLFILQSGAVLTIISIILFPVFLGLTIWEARRMKTRAQETALEGDAASANKVAVHVCEIVSDVDNHTYVMHDVGAILNLDIERGRGLD